MHHVDINKLYSIHLTHALPPTRALCAHCFPIEQALSQLTELLKLLTTATTISAAADVNNCYVTSYTV
jgi:hypothetical protein